MSLCEAIPPSIRGGSSAADGTEWMSQDVEHSAISLLTTIVPEGLGVIGENEWEEVELAVDSGAAETVVSEGMILSAEVRESAASRRGI